MALEIQQYSDNIYIITHSGILNVEEHSNTFHAVILPACQNADPDLIHVVNEMHELNMDFTVLIKLLDEMRARRTNTMPANLRQYLVGQNQWVKTIRDWIRKNDHEATALFEDVDLAIDYIKNL